MAHQARAYSGLLSMKRKGVFVLLPVWDAITGSSPSLWLLFSLVQRVKCLVEGGGGGGIFCEYVFLNSVIHPHNFATEFVPVYSLLSQNTGTVIFVPLK